MIENNINKAPEEETSPQEYTITKALKLETVNEGNKEDDVLVRGADNTVKYVPQSELGGGGSQNLQQTLEAGNIAEFDGGNSRVKILKGDPNSRTIELATSDGIIRSSMALGNTYASLSHSEPAPGRVNSNISATNEGIILSNNDNGTNGWYNMLKVPYNTTSQTTYSIPIDRPNGNYTLATVDQVKGGSQNLQQTLDKGSTATLSNQANESETTFYMASTELDSRISISSESHKMGEEVGGEIIITNGKIQIAQQNTVTNGVTSVEFEPPIGIGDAGAVLKFPAKEAGNYILATLDDITLQKASENNNTITDIQVTVDSTSKNKKTVLAGHYFNISDYEDLNEVNLDTDGITVTDNNSGTYATALSAVDLRFISPQANILYISPEHINKQNGSSTTSLVFDNPTSNATIHIPAKTEGDYTLATLDDITGNSPVSDTKSGIVDNAPLQELGGVDKLINGIRIGKGGGNLTTNVVLGDYALLSNSTGNNSTAIGYESMYSNTTGTYNTGIGSYSLYYNTTGLVNTSIGAYASTSNTTGSYNTVVGCNALNANQFGSANVAIGASALKSNAGVSGSNIYGHRSIAIGSNSMYNNTTGNGIAIGDTSLRSQTTGMYNIAIGLQAGSGITTGNANVIVADTGFIAAGGGITTGSNNMIIAPNNGNTTGITTGSGNVVLGKVTGLSASASNTITISDGVGNVAITKSTTGELKTPNLTQALIISGGATSLVNKGYVDNTGAVDNATTTSLASATLTTTYPNALSGFRVRCLNIASGALTYEKTTTGWIQYSIAIAQ